MTVAPSMGHFRHGRPSGRNHIHLTSWPSMGASPEGHPPRASSPQLARSPAARSSVSRDSKFALAFSRPPRHACRMQGHPPRKLIGVLGGMGPAATIDFMAKIVAATPARVDQEHVPLLVHGVPQIPDRSAAIAAGSDAPFLPMLAGIRLLEHGGVDLIAIPCHTAHYWYDRLARACGVDILHIADAVADTLRASAGTTRVAMLATRGTVAAGIYQARLAETVNDLVIPADPVQDLIDRTIAAVKANGIAQARRLAEQAAARLVDAGADRLLLACTELPIAFDASALRDRCIDPTEALARACVQASLGRDAGPVAAIQGGRAWTSAGCRTF